MVFTLIARLAFGYPEFLIIVTKMDLLDSVLSVRHLAIEKEQSQLLVSAFNSVSTAFQNRSLRSLRAPAVVRRNLSQYMPKCVK